MTAVCEYPDSKCRDAEHEHLHATQLMFDSVTKTGNINIINDKKVLKQSKD
jgi:hypothetical protein